MMGNIADVMATVQRAVDSVVAVEERVASLEAENQALREEVARLKQERHGLRTNIVELRAAAAPLSHLGYERGRRRDEKLKRETWPLTIGDVMNADAALLNSGGIPPKRIRR
jgi:predicted nuclease with TOPRIM domain